MTFNPIMAKTVASLTPCLPEKPTVLEFGSQTINLPDDFTMPEGVPKASELKGQSAKTFYERLGYSLYDCIDVSEKHSATLIDLNNRLMHSKLIGFDLVTNNGTGEHCFNQDAIFFNAHDYCKVGGIMLHILPFINWINHGFYSFHPTLFVDLARANHYEIVMFSLANRWGFDVSIASHSKEVITRELKFNTINHSIREAIRQVAVDEKQRHYTEYPNIMLVVAMRKTRDDAFIQPTQGKYLQDVSTHLPEVDHA